MAGELASPLSRNESSYHFESTTMHQLFFSKFFYFSLLAHCLFTSDFVSHGRNLVGDTWV